MRVLLLVSTLAVAQLHAGEIPSDHPLRELLSDPELMEQLAGMTRSAAAMSLFNAELAAFVARDDRGRLVLIPWGSDREALQTTFRGVRPRNVLAIVHTHPEGGPLPSQEDLRQAKRLRIPICVLTRRAIWVADVSSDDSLVLVNDPAWTSRWKRARAK